jgi:hypothetical protein
VAIRVNKREWKQMFTKDCRDKIRESYNEFLKYKKTKKVVFLQQAGNKLFSVVENWLMIKYNVRVTSYIQLRGVVKKNKYDRTLLSKVAQLHYFYYENELRGEASEFEDIYIEIYNIMKRRIK